jgi:DNA-binding beta-propeller fold protein YncE
MRLAKIPRLFGFGLAVLLFFSTSVAAAGHYQVLRRIYIPGDTGWDYITADTGNRRLYVPHGVEVVVLDLDLGVILGNIGGQRGLHGVAVAPEFGRGFISATDPGSVTIFDLRTLAVIDKLRVGDDPNGIIYDPRTHRVFTADRGSKRITAIDAKTGKIVATTEDLGGRTEHLAADGAGHVFLNMQDKGTVLKIDAQTLKVMGTWPSAPCTQPSSMDMDRAHQRLFIGCRGDRPLLTVVDAKSGKIIATKPIGPGVDALEFDPKTALTFVSTGGDGALSVFHEDTPDKYSLVEIAKTLPGARTLALDHKTGRVFLPVADAGPVPAATPENPRPRTRMLPGTFSVLVVGK